LAAYIPEDKISAIKNTADIVDIVSEVVSLRRAGRNFLGLCPFHAEKTPSFTVSPEKQIYYCFGCGTGGNVFSFLMKHGGLSFPEAARNLAGRYGIDLPTRDLSPSEKKKLTERETILTLNSEAMAFYRGCLVSDSRGKQAMGYLLKRGMTRKTITDHGLGFAPDGWDHLLQHIKARRQAPAMAAKAGLVIPRKKGDGHYDRFRNRIVFPIFSEQDQVIGFGGRVMDDALPKYLNSPETPVYNKRRSLYGLNRARGNCRKMGSIHVVEGYFDMLSMHQFGLENTVATLGTALTAEHVQRLRSLVGEGGRAILVYDSDQAGVRAAQRSIAVFEKGLLEARILVLPEGHDPDSFLMAHGPDDFLKVAQGAMGMMTFMVESAVARYGLGIDGKVHIVNAVKDAIGAIADPVARALQIKHLAERIDVDEAVVMQKIRQDAAAPDTQRRFAENPSAPAAARERPVRGETYRLERQVIAMMLQFPEIISDIRQRRLVEHFSDPLLADVGRGIIDHFDACGNDIAALVAHWSEPEKRSVVARLSLDEQRWDTQACLRLIGQFESSLRRRQDKALIKEIEAAEKRGDENLLARLLKERQIQARNAVVKPSGATH
jgi:DNA primase